MPTTTQRARLARDGIFNVRDLGGIRVRDGRVIAGGRLIRGDSLHRARDSVEVLHELGVVRVLDLRDERERDEEGVLSADGIEVQHHPVIDPMFAWFDESHDDPSTLLAHMYQEILTAFGARFATALASIAEVVSQRQDGAVAYHCAVGKDRTGLLTALLLGTLGASDADVVADYVRSGRAGAVQLSWLWSLGHPEGAATDDDLYVGLWSARAETMERTLEWLVEEFGGAAGYLEQSGVPGEVVEALEAGLVVDPTGLEDVHAAGR
jgi:protein-tyrosine phosphatase